MPDRSRQANLRWAVCALLFLITTVNYMDRSALGLVEPVLRRLLGGDSNLALYNRHYSDIVSCFFFANGRGFLVAGPVIDRIGAKKGLALSILVWACALNHCAYFFAPPAFSSTCSAARGSSPLKSSW